MDRRGSAVVVRTGICILVAALLAACSLPLPAAPAATPSATPIPPRATPPPTTGTDAPPPPSTTSAAIGVRATLDRLFGEHVMLVAFTTDAALNGRVAEAAAYLSALDGNSVDLAAVIGSVYGDAAGTAFLALWREHIDLVVAYTQALAGGDTAAADTAVQALLNYTFEFGDFLEGANPNLRSADVASLIETHILSLKAVIDAQHARDPVATYASLREGYGHMDHIALAIASALAEQFPETLGGDAGSAAADLRIRLNQILQEHVGLALSATGAALGGRTPEFLAAAAQLDANGEDLAAAFASLFGDPVGEEFLDGWRSHVEIIMTYTDAVADHDEAKANLQVQAFGAYTMEFGTLLNSVHPGLNAAGVAELFKMHWFGLQYVIDAQAAGDFVTAAENTRHGLGHMGLIADPFAEAFVQQAPDRFR